MPPTTEVWYVFHGTSLCEIDHKIIVIVLLMKITLLLRLRMQETSYELALCISLASYELALENHKFPGGSFFAPNSPRRRLRYIPTMFHFQSGKKRGRQYIGTQY
jgi:hypothetical protein